MITVPRSGVCLQCGRSIDQHFTLGNAFVPCDQLGDPIPGYPDVTDVKIAKLRRKICARLDRKAA